MADQTGIDLKPYKQERFIGGRQKVKLYYVNPDYHQAHKGRPPQQTVKNMAYTMPELGEAMIIDEVFASDILGKTEFKGKPIFMLESDGGGEVAQMIKAALAEGGDFSGIDLHKISVKRQLSTLNDDELAELMKQRGFKVEKATSGSTVKIEKDDPKSPKKDTTDVKDSK